jgi:hypothetical protein
MQARGVGGTLALFIINLGTTQRSVVSFMHRPFYAGKYFRRTHWLKGCADLIIGHNVMEHRITSWPCWESNHDSSVVKPVASS